MGHGVGGRGVFRSYFALCIQGFFCVLFFTSVDFFFKLTFSKNTIRVSNSLDPDQARHFIRPDLGLNCL